jgi:hypothetical protein
MKKLQIAAIIFFIIFIVVSMANAKLVLLPLFEMVEKSEIIGLGSVSKVQATTEIFYDMPLSKVTINFQKVLKGISSFDSIEVFFAPNFEDEPDFSVGGKSIFFIHKFQNRYVLVQGCAGKIDISGNYAINIHILNEPGSQKLKGFLKKIDKLLK